MCTERRVALRTMDSAHAEPAAGSARSSGVAAFFDRFDDDTY
jgi:hypothetical protein